ncbi:peptidoglycan editing factor PgeF [Alkalihalobacterium elongatum]|uniref:peptidoglycan editing factor PgeF n=1 Tax=Alkalihalobacterium elongatum TaxID=2675466 RepID=UPI001C1FF80C|nr:peptidoglycan editing factor PgeF [Alkalihalobacterium elongatum]
MVHEPFNQTGDELLVISDWEKKDNNLCVGFSTRLGGVGKSPYDSLNVGLHVYDEDSIVLKNRQIVAEFLNFPIENWVVGEQVHDAKIKKVTSGDASRGGLSTKTAIDGVDGLYTKEKNILLVSLYADCVPLYFFAPKHELIGLAHAGWKGTVGKIGPKMIEDWTTVEGIDVNDIMVVIGPAISQEEYEVDTNVIRAVDNALPSSEERPYIPSKPGHYLLDLKRLNKQLLINAGIPSDNIKTSQYCTASKTNLFFSHRKELGKTGRMMSYIGFNCM